MTHNLKLKAETKQDLTVISSSLQDAILRVGDIRYVSKSRYLTLRVTRYRHETGESARILTAVWVDSVLSVRSRGIDRSDSDAMAVLLSVDFVEGKSVPEGLLVFTFAGGGELSLHVECIDLLMADQGEPRITDKTPIHPDGVT